MGEPFGREDQKPEFGGAGQGERRNGVIHVMGKLNKEVMYTGNLKRMPQLMGLRAGG